MSDHTDTRHPADPPDWLSGSEMGRLIRAMDWTKMPLGPMDSWPPSLRTAVSICLDSRHPIVLWWGPERTMFYNDAYRPMLGDSKHPQFMGGSGQACWAEVWDIIGPMMDEVIATGRATWSEDLFLLMFRSGYLEETYFTFSYSPIRDEQGRPCGIFNACSESTGRVLSQRRLKMLREMAVEARTADEAARQCADILGHNPQDIPFALIYLADETGRQLRLAAQTGLAAGTAASPPVVELAAAIDGWPLARVFGQGAAERIDDLATRFSELPTEPWGAPPQQAMLLTIARPGRPQPAGVLVLGISPRRAFDEDYRGFFELAAGHVATAVANARAYDDERKAAEALAEIDRAKTAFFSNVSHEFRTPLTLMLGPLEEALAAPGLPAAERERIGLAHRNARRLQKLVNALLDFSRVEAGRVQACFEPTDLAAYTADLASVFRSAVEKAGLTLAVDCPPLPEPLYVDRVMWEKVVLNLLSNAFKHTFAGSIAVRLRWCGDHAECTVADSGVGIPAAELPHLFERFRRVQGAQSRTHEGTGIGLALVKELAQLHGGAVRVDSREGLGTSFTVTLPAGCRHLPPEQVGAGTAPPAGGAATYADEALLWLANTAADELPPPVEPAPPSPDAAGPAACPRVLWIDDNADMRDYVRRLLAGHYEVTALADGAQAVAGALAAPPDLVLSDVMMPGLDGFGVLRALRDDERTHTVPVILLSARAGEAARIEGLAAGADDYLVKPFSARELLARVDGALRLARLRREANEKLSRYVAELERANQELSSFAYAVSHDLRAPLRAMIGFSQALIEDFGQQVPAEAQRYLDEIIGASRRMGALIEGILVLSRCTRGDLQWETVDLSEMAEGIRKSLARSDPARRVTWRIEAGLSAKGDPRMLEAALENLLGNAWKYTAHVADPEIRLYAEGSQSERHFCVADNGAGFNMAHANRLFKPFQRLHREDEFPGIGIGLATVQRIIRRHGGDIEASGTPGHGAIFSFTLPENALSASVR